MVTVTALSFTYQSCYILLKSYAGEKTIALGSTAPIKQKNKKSFQHYSSNRAAFSFLSFFFSANADSFSAYAGETSTFGTTLRALYAPPSEESIALHYIQYIMSPPPPRCGRRHSPRFLSLALTGLQVPKFARALIPTWRRVLYLPRAGCLEETADVVPLQ